MLVKTKKQNSQEKRLQNNIRAAKQNKKDLKSTPKAAPKKQDGGIRLSLLQKLFGTKTAPETAQQSIPFREMCRDGICRVNDKFYT